MLLQWKGRSSLFAALAALTAAAALACSARVGSEPEGAATPSSPPPASSATLENGAAGAANGEAPVVQGAAGPADLGDTSCTPGSLDCNLCVHDVPARFNELRDHGEPLGFNRGDFDFNVAYGLGIKDHWEGIQRLPLDYGRYFIVSKRDGRPDGNVAHLVVMATRNAEGLRYRSNRLSTTIAQPESTPPPGDDRAVTGLPLHAGFLHGGGMQAVGNIVAIPMEEGPGNGRVVLYDYNFTTSPSPLAVIEGLSSHAGTASLTKLANGQHLLLLGQEDADKLEVYRSVGNIRSPSAIWARVDTWESWETSPWDSFQNLNFVTECNGGQLYLIGTSLGTRWGAVGSDYAHLYRVHVDTVHMRIEHVAVKQFYCSSDGSRQCNFDAGIGVYVGPHGNLLLYAMEHADDGPNGSVRLIEFRSVWPDPYCGGDLEHAFVDFYDDSDFTDRGFIFDYADRSLKNWSTFHQIDAFNDKASAVRWCIPSGHRVRLYADSSFRGSTKDLIGNGDVQEVNLNNWGFGDKNVLGEVAGVLTSGACIT